MLDNTHKLSNAECAKEIRSIIRHEEKVLIKKYPILRHQDQIGLAIFLLTIFIWVASAVAYFTGTINALTVIIINMLTTSILHELEHDIIHSQYYSKHVWEEIMKWGIYIFRGSQPFPDCRKRSHLHHHKYSGQTLDVEEVWVGNGMPWGLKRLIITIEQNLGSHFYYMKLVKENPKMEDVVDKTPKWLAVVILYCLVLYSFVWMHVISGGLALFSVDVTWPLWLISIGDVIDFLAIVWAVPSFLRLMALAFISSSMHYFGDIEQGDASIMQQTQVLNKWYYLPFNLFTFNFGSTHGIHHFVVNQPFYIRQMLSKKAHEAFREYGVRFNDTGSFKRANRYHNGSATTNKIV